MSRNTIGRLLAGALLSSGLLFGLTASPTHAALLAWTRQLRTFRSDFGRGVSADGLGNVYISGLTAGSLGGPNAGHDDAFVAKYDTAGNLQWIRQLGTIDGDGSTSVSADGLGNVYISGGTAGSLGGPNAGEGDAFVSKFDAAGNIQWTRQLGTSEGDESSGVSADGLGNVYISGYTAGSLGGPYAGGTDAFVAKYDEAGNLQWVKQLGSSATDLAGASQQTAWVTSISQVRPKAVSTGPTQTTPTRFSVNTMLRVISGGLGNRKLLRPLILALVSRRTVWGTFTSRGTTSWAPLQKTLRRL